MDELNLFEEPDQDRLKVVKESDVRSIVETLVTIRDLFGEVIEQGQRVLESSSPVVVEKKNKQGTRQPHEMTSNQAADMIGVDRVVIGGWQQRGHIEWARRSDGGRFYYTAQGLEDWIRSVYRSPMQDARPSLGTKLLNAEQASKVLNMEPNQLRQICYRGLHALGSGPFMCFVANKKTQFTVSDVASMSNDTVLPADTVPIEPAAVEKVGEADSSDFLKGKKVPKKSKVRLETYLAKVGS